MTMQIDSAVLYVVNLPSMAKFYADVFGLKPIAGDHADSWQEFYAGAFRLGLHQIPHEVLENIQPAPSIAPRERAPIKLVLAVSDLEKTRTILEAQGVTVRIRPWGGYDVVDPEGNVFGLTQASS